MKIFCIGFNKTGTTSLHHFFLKNKLKSTHNTSWWNYTKKEQFNSYDVYTDGYERYENKRKFPDLKFLKKTFSDCKFILNTRDLDKWLLSRLNHHAKVYLTGLNQNYFDDKVFLRWVNDRNDWYEIIEQSSVFILNIESFDIKKLSKFLDKELKFGIEHKNSSKKNRNNELLIQNFLKKFIIEKDHKSDYIVILKFC